MPPSAKRRLGQSFAPLAAWASRYASSSSMPSPGFGRQLDSAVHRAEHVAGLALVAGRREGVLEDREAGQDRRDVGARRGRDRPVRVVRRDGDVVRLGERGDPQQLLDPAAVADVRLDQVDELVLDQLAVCPSG